MSAEGPQPRPDLNQLASSHPFDPGQNLPPLDYSAGTEDGAVQVYFRDLERRLIEHIRRAEYVIGCVYRLTSFPVLGALRRTRGVSIVVQKMPELRTEYEGKNGGFYRALRTAYYNLPSFPRRLLPGRLSRMRVFPYVTAEAEAAAIADGSIAPGFFPVQCVGYSSEGEYRPLAHSKFLLFCRYNAAKDCLHPYEVWTGSYNPTGNARRSIEDAVVLRSPEIVRAYYRQYSQVAALSEPIEWDNSSPAPQLVLDAGAYLTEIQRQEDEMLERMMDEDMRMHTEHPYPDPAEDELNDDWFDDDADPGEEGLDDWRQDERAWL